MTVSTSTNRQSYTGDGVSTVFGFPNKFISASDIKVYVGGVLQSTGYTVGTPTDSGANITFSVAPANLASIVILSDPARTQGTSLPSTGPFPAKSVETMADKLTLLVQRLYDLTTRSFTLSDGDTTTSAVLPSPTANSLLGWNASGNALQNVPVSSLGTSIVANTWVVDKFSGTGAQTAFTLSAVPGNVSAVICSVNGVIQTPGVNFSLAVNVLTFLTGAPASGSNNVVVQYGQTLQTVGTADLSNTVGTLPVASGGTGATAAAAARSNLGAAQSGANTDITSIFGQTWNKNVVINGGFTINQRSYVSAAVLTAGTYGHDRWKAGASGGDYSFTQLASNTQITIAAGKSLIQVIEDKNVQSTRYVLSWTGTAQARVGVNSATPSGAYAASPIVITGQTVGTNMSIEFNTGTLGTVQLEATTGSVATPFEQRSYGLEFALCQRYYQTILWLNSIVATGASQDTYTTVNFPVTMRIAPASVVKTAGTFTNTTNPNAAVVSASTLQDFGRSVAAGPTFAQYTAQMSSEL